MLYEAKTRAFRTFLGNMTEAIIRLQKRWCVSLSLVLSENGNYTRTVHVESRGLVQDGIITGIMAMVLVCLKSEPIGHY
jgi:hypothetical protein